MPVLFSYAPPLVWALGCAILALIYFRVWPRRKVEGTRGWRYVIVRWFHGLVWVLLGISLALHALPDESGHVRVIAKLLAVLALVVYVTFLFATYGMRAPEPGE